MAIGIVSGTVGYNYPGVFGGGPAKGSGIPYIGRGPIDAYIVNSGALSLSIGAGTTITTALSGVAYQQSSTFNTETTWSTVFNSTDMSLWSNISVSLINNSVHNLKSASLEWSPNNSNFEQWDVGTFQSLSSSAMLSMQISGNSRRWFRIRAQSSGSAALGNTGSLDIYVIANDG
jgi:hypothetical protein